MSASTQVRSPLRRHSRPLIGLCVFLVVCLALIWTVFVTLQREVDGETHSYSAVFTDVSGLKVGDEVRMAGVKVGRVDDVALDGTQARVQFRVQSEQVLYGNTKASIVYQNIIGQRYLGLSLADYGDPSVLPAGAVIPVEHTEPSFDISKLLNGFEPLFALLSPEQVDNLTMAIVRSLQGDTGAIATMISETTRLAESYSGTDAILDGVLTHLNSVVASLADHSGALEDSIKSAETTFNGFAARRVEFVDSMDQISVVGDRLANVITDVQPDMREWLAREPGFAKHFMDDKQGFAYMAFNTPLMLKGMARFSQGGAFLDVYACNLTVTQFPRIDSLINAIVREGTREDRLTYSQKCR
ncbi:mammalian cell entry protein [Mycolicibacterium moriokaense]|jgi:phospholipid/cholesterol/gamma-HCH transport system substrate-binding protein|uniref:Mce family protein n=1 Tax=Mycolicibacterium moriokaense TaxID=39691 RepID=A0AAD1HAG3_9MYCO|nr:MlaD family protein [Mycolicibacterium moriokaense]MCV7039670.1 MCE family protein [Mycolicibacterium moriokaense]ORB19882.1 mammalian cell entry protein [Mycolicibacterium moriokaense]BBX01882.1 putative Mce family protein [Mycolicibacterium moriokaense]